MNTRATIHGGYITEGTISRGTLRMPDLIKAFADEYERLSPFTERKLINEARAWLAGDDDSGGDDETGQEIVNELHDAIDRVVSRHGFRFGAHDGDGSDFGTWRNDSDDSDDSDDDDDGNEGNTVMHNIKPDAFTQAYLDCALWSSTGDDGEPLDATYSVDDISEDSVARAVAACADFRAENEDALSRAGSDEQNGHDFWLTRNQHGAGFWTRGYADDIQASLTDAAHATGGVDLYVGDDGALHFTR